MDEVEFTSAILLLQNTE